MILGRICLFRMWGVVGFGSLPGRDWIFCFGGRKTPVPVEPGRAPMSFWDFPQDLGRTEGDWNGRR